MPIITGAFQIVEGRGLNLNCMTWWLCAFVAKFALTPATKAQRLEEITKSEVIGFGLCDNLKCRQDPLDTPFHLAEL